MKTFTLKSITFCVAISLLASAATAKTENSDPNAISGNSNDSGKTKNKNHDKNRNHRGNRGQGQAFEPFHSNYVVLPGDTFYVISLKEYATSANAKFIARFNHLPESQALVPGQTINLPSISPKGVLAPSHAPVADSLQAITQPAAGSNFNSPAACNSATKFSNPAKAIPLTLPKPLVGKNAQAAPAPLTRVAVGSTLLVDGLKFGDEPGSANLRIGGAPFKVEVLTWTTDAVTIRLPQIELATPSKADLELIGANGEIASRTTIELSVPTNVALAK